MLPHLVGSQKHTGTMAQGVGSSKDLRPPQFTVQGQFDGEIPTHRPPRHNAVGRMIGSQVDEKTAWRLDGSSFQGYSARRGSWQWGQMTILAGVFSPASPGRPPASPFIWVARSSSTRRHALFTAARIKSIGLRTPLPGTGLLCVRLTSRVQSCRAGGPDTPRINEEVTFKKVAATGCLPLPGIRGVCKSGPIEWLKILGMLISAILRMK
jgi:hypothetical protein